MFWRDTRHRKDILDADDGPACTGLQPHIAGTGTSHSGGAASTTSYFF
jgi:hypothetical protein